MHGHDRLDWEMLGSCGNRLFPCWQGLAHCVEAAQQGRAPIAIDQLLRSTGLALQPLQHRSGALLLRVGPQGWQLLPSPQALWTLQDQERSEPRQVINGTWLGLKPSASQWRWLLQHGAGLRFLGL